MKRKVLKIGQSSLAVSLPYAWTKTNGVRSGADMDLQEMGGQLVLSVDAEPVSKEIAIDVPTLSHFKRRLLIAPYVAGYDIITLHFNDPLVRQKAQEAVQELMGCDLFNQRRNSLEIKVIAEGKESEFRSVFKRMFHLNREILVELKQALHEQNKDLFEAILTYEVIMNKLNYFCRRLLNGKIRKPIHELTGLYAASGHLEEIADNLKLVIYYVQESKKFPKELEHEIETMIKIHDKCFQLFNKVSVDGMIDFKNFANDAKLELIEKCRGKNEWSYAYAKLHTAIDHYRSITEQIQFDV